jgi:hypothetical protein
MPTESEIKIARYTTVKKVPDDFGRVIGVRRLKPSEQAKISGMTADLTGADEAIDANGQKMLVPHRMPLMVAAAVCEIDGSPVPFPRNRGELDAIYDRLDVEGLGAAARAMAELTSAEVAGSPLEEAKNL